MEKKLSEFGFSRPEFEKKLPKEVLTPFSDNIFDKLASEYWQEIQQKIELTYPFLVAKLKQQKLYEPMFVMMLESFKTGLKLHMDYLDFAEKKLLEVK